MKSLWHHSATLNNQILASFVDLTNQARVLDIGCGEGTLILERLGGRINKANIYGIEIKANFVKKAQKKGIKAIHSSAEKKLPFKKNYFDIVSANQIIEHILNVDLFAQEIYRVLKPGGYLILSTENLASWHNIFALVLGWQPFSQHISLIRNIGNPLRIARYANYDHADMHIKIFTRRSLRELFELHEFTIEKTPSAGYYPLPPNFSKIFSSLDPMHTAFIGLKARKTRQ